MRTDQRDQRLGEIAVQSYPTEPEAMRDVLPDIPTPVQIISGRSDAVVPLVNAECLHERLRHSELRAFDAGNFAWEDVRGARECLVGRRVQDMQEESTAIAAGS